MPCAIGSSSENIWTVSKVISPLASSISIAAAKAFLSSACSPSAQETVIPALAIWFACVSNG